eukprot:1446033-Amphidinium_carterae.2
MKDGVGSLSNSKWEFGFASRLLRFGYHRRLCLFMMIGLVCVCVCVHVHVHVRVLFTAGQLEESPQNCCKNTKTTAEFQPV